MPTLALDRLCLHPGARMCAQGSLSQLPGPRAEALTVSYGSQLAQHWVGTEERLLRAHLSGRNANAQKGRLVVQGPNPPEPVRVLSGIEK